MSMLKNLKTQAGIQEAVDRLGVEESIQSILSRTSDYDSKMLRVLAKKLAGEANARQAQENKARGIQPTVVTFSDLCEVIETILSYENITVIDVLRRQEQHGNRFDGWADKVAKKTITSYDKDLIREVFDYLCDRGNHMYDLMKFYKELDLNSILRADTYRVALSTIRKQLDTTLELHVRNMLIAERNEMIKEKERLLEEHRKQLAERDVEIQQL